MAYQFAGRYIEALLKNVNGRPRLLASTLVTIYESDGTTEATVYTDRTKASAAANPVTTDSLGNLALWLDPGSYYGAPIIDGVAQIAFPIHVDIDPAEADTPPASEVVVTPAGGISATNVQAALVELDTEKATTGSVTTVSTALTAHEGDGTDAHDASAVSFVPAGTVAATDVQGAIVEVSGDVTAEAAARATADALLIPLTQKGAANGVATLGADSKIPSAQLPSLAISEFLGTTASQAAMLALAGQRGDYTVRTDTAPSSTWILTTDDPTQLANWLQISTVTDAVSSVNGRTGAVVGLAEASAVVAKSLYDANSVIIAQTDDTPEALAMGFFRVLGRMGGNIGSLTGADLATLIGDPSGVTLTTTGKNGLSPRRFSGRKTTAGAPTTGTWAVDDEVMDSAGVIWRCTVAGTPGTWASFSGTIVAAPTAVQTIRQPADDTPGLIVVAKGLVTPTVYAGDVFAVYADGAAWGAAPAFYVGDSDGGVFVLSSVNIGTGQTHDNAVIGNGDLPGHMLGIWGDEGTDAALIALRGSGSKNYWMVGLDRSGERILWLGEYGELDRRPVPDTLPSQVAGTLREIAMPTAGGFPAPTIGFAKTGDTVRYGRLVAKRTTGSILAGVTSATSSYANVTTVKMLGLRKHGSAAETELLVTVRATVSTNANAGLVQLGLNWNGADYDGPIQWVPASASHYLIQGTFNITTAGIVATSDAQLRVKSLGAATVSTDGTNDYAEFTVEEVLMESNMIVAQDTFTRADSATSLDYSDSGHKWQGLVGTWGISSNKAYMITATGQAYVEIMKVNEADVDITLDITAVTACFSGVFFRYTDASNHWYARIEETSDTVKLFKVVAGSTTQVASVAVTISNGVTYSLRVVAKSTDITVYVDGVSKIVQAGQTDNQTAVKMGLFNANNGAAVRYDNLVIKRAV